MLIILNSIHPQYAKVLRVAKTNTYALPTYAQLILTNGVFRRLYYYDIFDRIEFLYIYMHNSSTVDISRINIVRASFTLSTNSPSFLADNGIGNAGTEINTNFNMTSDVVLGTNSGNCHVMVYSKVGGSNITQVQNMINGSDAGQLYTVRSRTNPRTDGGIGTGLASPSTIQAGDTQSNTMYGLLRRFNGTDYDFYSFVDGTETFISNGSSGTLPSTNTVSVANAMLSGRYVGAVSGGLSLTTQQVADLNTLIQYYNTNL